MDFRLRFKIARFTAHFDQFADDATGSLVSIVQGLALETVEMNIAVETLGKQMVRTSMRAYPRQIHFTTGLIASAVRVEAGHADRYGKTEISSARVYDLNILGIIFRQSFVHLVVAEEWTSWIQPNDFPKLTNCQVFSS